MTKWWSDIKVVCHWCNKHYTSKKGRLQARFCSKACKQAHYRAYKKYITAQAHVAARIRPGPGRRK